MEELCFDSGVMTFRVNGGECLRFNPSDPNLYARLQEAGQQLEDIKKSLSGEDMPQMLRQADGKLKALLQEVFPGNDMEAIFMGVNLLSPTKGGRTVFENFMAALEPVLSRGAADCARELLGAQDD